MTRERLQIATSRPLWWLLEISICLALAPTLIAQPMYKVTDADGNVTFTDTPPLSGEGTIEEQRIMMFPDGCGNIVEFKSLPATRVFEKPSIS